jgi:hypothetical protein
MKLLIKLEELALFILALWGLYFLNAEWWYYLLLLLGPDISMIGYFAGNKVGALLYNIFHHKAIAVAAFIIGMYWQQEILVLISIVLFGHSSMDRFFGYGLKLNEGFKFTHLGKIGNAEAPFNQ